ncbi:unnamed protein product [Cylicocyclus nassatus]|uniref:Uncharacterized protein n=1 Tax=Cylicocyclus nassatus TaxID=53992 RepID=A0AA36H8N9_CYLNA|nr:unnamed protein product [Cylicocyclus nassatus]
MLYILFGVTFVSSVFASPKQLVDYTCVQHGGCNSCTQKWRNLFKDIFELRCRETQPVKLTYHGWVAHLIDFFVYGVWIDSNRVRIFKVEREENCDDIGEAAVEMLADINKLNKRSWKPINTCTMFTEKCKFACKPYREKEQSGFWLFTTFTTKHVVLCAFTGMEGVEPIPKYKWTKLDECREDWKRCRSLM